MQREVLAECHSTLLLSQSYSSFLSRSWVCLDTIQTKSELAIDCKNNNITIVSL